MSQPSEKDVIEAWETGCRDAREVLEKLYKKWVPPKNKTRLLKTEDLRASFIERENGSFFIIVYDGEIPVFSFPREGRVGLTVPAKEAGYYIAYDKYDNFIITKNRGR